MGGAKGGVGRFFPSPNRREAVESRNSRALQCRRVTAVDLTSATKNVLFDDDLGAQARRTIPLPVPLPAGLPIALPFLGRIDSYQFLGLGRLDVAQALCQGRDFAPVPYGPDQALIQLSFMRWKSSSVGPYCSSFLGLPVAPRSRRPAAPRLPMPAAARLLSAFLHAPPVLFVPAYAVGDAPGGPTGCGVASQRFGWQSLDVHKTTGRFVVNERDGVTHLQALESRRDGARTNFVTGYSISLGAPAPGIGGLRLPMSPTLMPCLPLLAARAAQTMRTRGQQPGVILVDSVDRPGNTVHIATRFTTRPRLHDLTADRRAAFAPLVLRRPAPAGTLGCLLERLAFEPAVALRDPDMTGAILGPVPRLEDALA